MLDWDEQVDGRKTYFELSAVPEFRFCRQVCDPVNLL
jgi:hypothetical protein